MASKNHKFKRRAKSKATRRKVLYDVSSPPSSRSDVNQAIVRTKTRGCWNDIHGGYTDEDSKKAQNTALSARARHSGITTEQAKRPTHGYEVGRLLEAKKITVRQADALNEVHSIIAGFLNGHQLIPSGNAKAMDWNKAKGDAEPTDEQDQAFVGVKDKYNDLYSRITKIEVAGKHVWRSLQEATYYNKPTNNWQGVKWNSFMKGVRECEKVFYG